MARVISYIDPVDGTVGHLVYDRDECRLAAGGFRIQPGLAVETLADLASRMTLKQRVLGINVDGAKCGLDHDPAGPDRAGVERRFVTFLLDELRSRYSMGCDMGTRFEVLEGIAAGAGLPSVKYAVKDAQGFSDEEFTRRMRLLDAPVGSRTLGQRRAGHALAHAALGAAAHAGLPLRGLRCAVQGFGNLGRAAAESLVEAGARITAVADEYGCVADPSGLDLPSLMAAEQGRPVGGAEGGLRGDALFDQPADVLVLAAVEDALDLERSATLAAPIVVVGANRGLDAPVEQALVERGVLVVPDFIGGIGGSASMETLFGPDRTPEPGAVLDALAGLMRELMADLLTGADARGIAPGQVARDIAAAATVTAERPYGSSPYRVTGTRPRGDRVAASRLPSLEPHVEIR